jgi:hypothetical protein
MACVALRRSGRGVTKSRSFTFFAVSIAVCSSDRTATLAISEKRQLPGLQRGLLQGACDFFELFVG